MPSMTVYECQRAHKGGFSLSADAAGVLWIAPGKGTFTRQQEESARSILRTMAPGSTLNMGGSGTGAIREHRVEVFA